jgi:hypothetical protein
MKTYRELEAYRADHPDAPLYACANFDGKVHLTERASRRWLYTWCGLSGVTKEHMLMFCMPLSGWTARSVSRLRGGVKKMNWESSPVILSFDIGGKDIAKSVILNWLVNTGGSNLKLLETATGLPQKLLSPLLAEMMAQRTVRLDGAVFRVASYAS